MAEERLQKIIAKAGLASRRAAERMIIQGRVAVDGRKVTTLGAKADPAKSTITVDGKPLSKPERYQYWMLNKPRGVVTTAQDPENRPVVLDFLPPEARARLYPVGRLDVNSEGLVLLTNHGELAHRITHPSHHIPKHYKIWVSGRFSPKALEMLRKGVELEDGPTAPARVNLKSAGPEGSKLNITLGEGRKRQIRRMCREVGHPVKRLLRVGLGPLRLGDLPPAQARRLTVREIESLLQETGLLTGCKASGNGVNKSNRKGRKARVRETQAPAKKKT